MGSPTAAAGASMMTGNVRVAGSDWPPEPDQAHLHANVEGGAVAGSRDQQDAGWWRLSSGHPPRSPALRPKASGSATCTSGWRDERITGLRGTRRDDASIGDRIGRPSRRPSNRQAG